MLLGRLKANDRQRGFKVGKGDYSALLQRKYKAEKPLAI